MLSQMVAKVYEVFVLHVATVSNYTMYAMQKALREARKTVLSELRVEAHQLGADAVVAVSLNYSEVSGGGKSMVFVVASGTAVTLTPE